MNNFLNLKKPSELFDQKKKKKNKYNAQTTTISVFWRNRSQILKFHSKGEAEYAKKLIFLEKQGEISNLQLQEKFLYFENKEEKCHSIVDFCYYKNDEKTWRIDQFKSKITVKKPEYVIQRKLMKARFEGKFKYYEVFYDGREVEIF